MEAHMTIFTVHLPKAVYSETGADRPDLLARAVFVPEKFSWGAFIFGPFWLLSHGLWLAFLVWLVAIIVLSVVAADFLTTGIAYTILLAIEFFLGLEGNILRRGKLARRGYRLVDVVIGASREEAERAFFAGWAGKEPNAPAPPPLRSQVSPPDTHSEVLGHFPLPEGRG
jgi:hypothetical protein